MLSEYYVTLRRQREPCTLDLQYTVGILVDINQLSHYSDVIEKSNSINSDVIEKKGRYGHHVMCNALQLTTRKEPKGAERNVPNSERGKYDQKDKKQ